MNPIRYRMALTALAAAAVTPTQACSVCIAHALGAGLQAIGAQSLHHGKVILGTTFTSFSKSQAGELPGTNEHHSQTEINFEAMAGLADNWMIRASVPYVRKTLDATGEERDTSQGIGDATLGVSYQVPPKPNQKLLWATTLDVKLPTGANSLRKRDGTLKEEHNQLGTGSTDFAVGALASWEASHGGLWFAGLQGRVNGANGRGYRYGQTLFYNVGYSLPVRADSAFVFELNGRIAAKDRTETGDLDPNSGGHLGYLSVSFRHNLGPAAGLVAGVQLPVLKQLNGSQRESALMSVGIFGRF